MYMYVCMCVKLYDLRFDIQLIGQLVNLHSLYIHVQYMCLQIVFNDILLFLDTLHIPDYICVTYFDINT